MGWNIFGVVEIKSIWNLDDPNEEYIGIKLLLALFGYISGFWIAPVMLTANFSIGLLNSIRSVNTPVLTILASGLTNVGCALLYALVLVIVILRRSTLYEEFDLRNQYIHYKMEIVNRLVEAGYSNNRLLFGLIIVLQMLTGLVNGLLSSLFYSIPHFILYVFLIFIISNFVPFGPVVMVLAIILALLVITWYVLRNYLELTEDEQQQQQPSAYSLSKRNEEILKSDRDPILCQSCRSFISASKSICPVCSHEVDQADTR